MAITSINLGKIKFNWKGAWALGVAYSKDDVVRYSGSSYVCVTGHTSATSWATNSSKFEVMAEGTTPTTTQGDLIYRGSSVDTRLGIGASGQVLTVSANGLPVWGESGVNQKIYYVSPTGSNSNSGQSWGTAFATIKYACSVATGPASIKVASGTYTEQLPIIVPSFVAVIGDSQRTTIIGPASGYEQLTMWKLGDGALLNKMCFIGLTGYVPYAPDPANIELATIGGVYVALNSAVPIATKSPYVIECTAKSAGGVGALVDGSLHASGNKSMVFHGFTVILDDGVGYWVKANGKSEIVSCFTYFCQMGYVATGGGKIRALNGNNSYGTYGALASGFNAGESTVDGTVYGNMLTWQAGTLVGSFADGNTITGATSGTTATVLNIQPGTSRVYYKKLTGTAFTAGETVSNGAGASITIATGGVTGQSGVVLIVTGLSAEPKPGGSVSITGDTISYVVQSSSGWTNSGSVVIMVLAADKAAISTDGTAMKLRYDYSNIRLTGHDFLSIGTGGIASTNYPGVPTQASSQGNEVVELFPGRVFYVSTDQDGNFRVGEYFKVDQATGRATLNASAFDLSGLTSLRLGSIGAQLGELVNEFSSDVTLSGNSNTAIPTERAVKQYFTQISSNNVPSVDDTYSLGTSSKRWSHVYVGPGSITIGSLTISDNAGTLEVNATSGGTAAPTKINSINNGNSSVAVAANSDVTLTANGTTSATFSSTGVVIAGSLTVNGTTTTINSNTLTVDDVNVVLGSVSSIAGLTGTVTSAATSSVVTGLATTSGLIPGMALTKTAGTGAFGTSTIITTIDSATQITVTGVSSHTAGALTFTAGGATDITANGGGITIKGTTDKTLTWLSSASAFTSSEDINVVTGKQYEINGTSVLTSTTLGSGVTGSSLTSFGTTPGMTSPAITTSLTTPSTSFDLVNTTATTVNFAGAATTISIGAASGATTNLNGILAIKGSSSGSVKFQAAAAAGSTTYTLPSADGTSGQALVTNASGVLSWATNSVTIGDDTSTTTLYPTMTTATSGSITSAKVSSTKLTFDASTGYLTASGGVKIGLTSTANGSRLIVRGTSGGGYNTAFVQSNSTVQIISDEMSVNQWYPTLNIAMVRQSLTTGSNAFGGIGFSTIDDSNDSGQYDAARIAIVNEGGSAVLSGTAMAFYTQVGSVSNTNAATEKMRISSTGNLTVSAGSVTALNGFIESSSIALKENVNPITGALDAIMSLVGVTYDRKNGSSKNEAGLIAEDVDQVLPNLVSHKADGSAEGIYYSKLTAYLVEAIKDLKSQIDPLKEEIKKLKGE